MKLKAIVMDIDGTLTDGKINISDNGELFKSFCVYDGFAISHLLPLHNVLSIVITGRCSKITEKRCEELGIQHFYQGINNKLEKLQEILTALDLSFEQIGYIGDDLNDMEAMLKCRIKACPSNAVTEIKRICDYICMQNGGSGAVREFIDWLIANEL